MNLPSIKTLEDAFPGKGREVRGLLEGTIRPDSYKSVQSWVAQCHNPPRKLDRMLCALNEVIEGHGVEAVFQSGEMWPDMEYINMGDTYNTTLIYDHGKGRFIVGCWGDWIERNDRNGRKYG